MAVVCDCSCEDVQPDIHGAGRSQAATAQADPAA